MSHPLTILAVVVLVLLALDIAALRWGVDSRFLAPRRRGRQTNPPQLVGKERPILLRMARTSPGCDWNLRQRGSLVFFPLSPAAHFVTASTAHSGQISGH